MTWTQFLGGIAGIYSLYYLANIAIDLMKGRGLGKGSGWVNELTFSEDFKPKKALESGPVAFPGTPSPIIESGGVCLKDLFTLARKDAIQLTRKVSF